jgi:hypothetical protein
VGGIGSYLAVSVDDNASVRFGNFVRSKPQKQEDVEAEVTKVGGGFRPCNNCMDAGVGAACTLPEGIWGRCSRCAQVNRSDCVYFHGLHFSSDMGGAQAAAIEALVDALQPDSDEYRKFPVTFGFGMLHFLKSLVRAVRNYVLNNSIDTFCITDIHAIFASSAPLAVDMAKVIAGAGLAFVDRHSDQLGWDTCNPEMGKLLVTVFRVFTTVYPEPYLSPLKAAKLQPDCDDVFLVALAVNARGHVFVADAEQHCIRVFLNRVPEPSFVVTGVEGNKGIGKDKARASEALFNTPVGLAIAARDNKREDLYIVDRGNATLRCLRNVHNVDTGSAKVVELVTVNGALKDSFSPWGVTVSPCFRTDGLVMVTSDSAE